MGKGRKKVLVSFVAGLMILFSASAVNAGTLSVQRVEQAKTNWCWAASAEMVGTYNTTSNLRQYEIVYYFHGESYPNVGGTRQQIATGINYSSNYTKSAYTSNFFTLSSIKSNIDKAHPFVIWIDWNSGGSHAVVGAGYSGSSVYVIDPWPGISNRYYTYSSLQNGGSFATGTGRATSVIAY